MSTMISNGSKEFVQACLKYKSFANVIKVRLYPKLIPTGEDNMDYQRNKKYFAKPNTKWGVILLVVGILGLFGFSSDAGQICGVIGLVLAGIGAFLLFGSTVGKPTDSEINQICKTEIEDLKQKALRKLGIDEEEINLATPIVLDGPAFYDLTTPFLYKKGNDNGYRSSNYEGMILFFSESQVHSYKYAFSIIADEHTEHTDEYFYRDIVTISTSSEKFKVKTQKGSDFNINFEQFKITTSGGTSLSCSLLNPGALEKSIHGMRQLLRQKKTE